MAGFRKPLLVLFLLVLYPVYDSQAQVLTVPGNCIIVGDDTLNGEEVTCTITPRLSCEEWDAQQGVWAGYSPSELVAILGGYCEPLLPPLRINPGAPRPRPIVVIDRGPCGDDPEDLSCLGCDGIPYSGLIEDACGVCGGDGRSCSDLGPCGGGPEDLSCLGCDGIPYSGLIEDACGVCDGDGRTCYSGDWT